MLTTKSKIGFDQFILGQVGFGLALDDRPYAPLDLLRRHFQIFLDMPDIAPGIADFFGHVQDRVMSHAQRADHLCQVFLATVVRRQPA